MQLRRKNDFSMEILEEFALKKALNIGKKIQTRKTHGKIYEVMDEKQFEESKVKFHKDLSTKFKSEFNVPQFISLEIKKKIQQVGSENGFFNNCED